MKKILFFFVFAVISWTSSAQNVKKVVVKSDIKGCWAALISEKEAKAASSEYGWWSVWKSIKEQKKYKPTPATFTNVPKGKYTVVIYNPASVNFDPNAGKPEEAADGVVFEEANIQKDMTFQAKKAEFKTWYCLSCPYLYIWNGNDFLKQTEVIKDVVGKASEQKTSTKLAPACIIKQKVKIRIQEEKDETSYLNRIALKVGENVYFPDNSPSSLQNADNAYHTLKKGEMIELEFTLPAQTNPDAEMVLETTGYYEPDAKFLADIYQKYLKTK